ncbi:MAG: valine--tRNA ligase [Hominenteromicrobium sp.]
MEKYYDFARIEPQMQAFWKEEGIYKFDPNRKGPVYSIDTPPPTVSGSLHIGHLFSFTQAEIIARFHRMQGENVFYPFGFDDNGLPTERLVERETGLRAADLPRSEFIEKCSETAEKYEAQFRTFWESLGFSVDWDTQYRTVSPEVQKISQSLFLELVRDGRAYMKESPVLWCTECRTSIAQAELETIETETTFNYLPFVCGEKTLEVATTRPELLFGCVCLFVHPDDARYRDFVGRTARVPLYDFDIPILTDDKAAPDKGTGVVMCATFGDSTDAAWYTEHNLPYRRVILPDGRIAPEVPFLGGMTVRAARAEILRRLGENGLLLRSEQLTHTVAVHERCGRPVEILPSRQWYIDILSEKERFLKAADEINWYPPQMKSRYTAWVENLKWDWCISRQRYFGVPFPVWYCADCGKPVFAAPEQLPLNPIETPYTGKCDCGCTKFIPETAVFDTWATSSITPQINERLGLDLVPMSMRTHAHEIIRTWTFYTIVRSLYHTGKLPWRDLMICGFVLAKPGEKMSKSKGNALDPERLIRQHSADVLRYWTAGAHLGTDTFFSPAELDAPKRFVTKLWNAAKFVFARLEGFDPKTAEATRPADRWLLARCDETMRRAQALLDGYEIGAARKEIDDLFWKDFCDNALELLKDRLYNPETHGEANTKSAQAALYGAFLRILKLYAIYVPHITEYLYQLYFRQFEGEKSIHRLCWEKPDAPDNRLLAFGGMLKETLAAARKYKTENGLSMKAALPLLELPADGYEPWFRETERDLLACTGAREIRYR